MARIREAHVAPLNQLVDQIADARVLPRSHIPYIDISIQITGGVQARALVMLDNPSTRVEAGTGSGLLSLDNDDRMARNLYEAYERHKIHWSNVLPWNAAPFPVAHRNGSSTRSERREGAHGLGSFFAGVPSSRSCCYSAARLKMDGN